MKTLDDKQVQTLIDEFYSESSEGIVGLFAIAQAVEDLIPNADAAREQTLQIVDGLLSKGMAAGDSPYSAGGYQPWPNQNRTTVMHRIRSEWMDLGRSPSIPDIAWFGPAKQA